MSLSRAALLGLAVCLCTQPASAETKPAPFDSTHKQVRMIRPSHDGKPIALNTFTLDRDGNILACVGGDKMEYLPAEDGSFTTKTISAPKLLQKYSPDGDLLCEFELDFKPTAINEAADGSIFVAGAGKVAHLSAAGKVLASADSPHLGDMDELRAKVEKAAKEQMEQLTGSMKEQTERVEKMLEKLAAKDEAELTDREKKRIKVLEQQKKMFCDQQEQMEEMYADMFSVDTMLQRSMEITSLAVNSKDLYVCCGSPEGYGYEVWRMNHELSEPKKVVSDLGGCCGQCDIQANEDYLVLAENTKFQVGLLDRDGNRVSGFGSQDRTSKEGFGSCCNPMNVKCCSNGDILTAESSIGYIKRFNKEGEFLGTVGKARIGGGCKHVAIGHDEKRDRYYMQYEDRNAICVLLPKSEAPEFTEDELLAKAAREGLGQKLVGDGKTLSGEWSLDGKRPAKAKAGNAGVFGAISVILGDGTDTDAEAEVDEEELVMSQDVTYFCFHADGKMDIRGTYSENGNNGWEPVSQDLKTNTIRFLHLEDGISYNEYAVKLLSDDKAEFSMMYGDQVMSTKVYTRIPVEAKEDVAAVEGDSGTADEDVAKESAGEKE